MKINGISPSSQAQSVFCSLRDFQHFSFALLNQRINFGLRILSNIDLNRLLFAISFIDWKQSPNLFLYDLKNVYICWSWSCYIHTLSWILTLRYEDRFEVVLLRIKSPFWTKKNFVENASDLWDNGRNLTGTVKKMTVVDMTHVSQSSAEPFSILTVFF